jgi:hypothetical protein
MYYLVYISYAVKPFNEAGLQKLLVHCRDNNVSNEITGILIYIDGKFVQILEGQQDQVKSLFETISMDPRHSGVRRILEGQIGERNFPNFSMGFEALDIDTFTTISGFKSIEEFFNYPNVQYQDHPAIRFLRIFKERESPTATDVDE